MQHFKYIPLIILFSSGFITACSATPTAQLKSRAADMDAEIQFFSGGYPQVIVYKGLTGFNEAGVVHVYIGGDGLPMLNGGRSIASDPTVFDETLFPLFEMDTSPKVFIGRPCYYRMHYDSSCTVGLWTVGRYSEAVVTAMQKQMEALIDKYSITEVVLIGFSGGGSLSVLLAERIFEVKAVVSIAGNIDTEAWTQAWGYTPLSASLNPKEHFREDIPYWLLVGSNDGNVTRDMYKKLNVQANVHIAEIDGYDHQCCWAEIWAEWLEELQAIR